LKRTNEDCCHREKRLNFWSIGKRHEKKREKYKQRQDDILFEKNEKVQESAHPLVNLASINTVSLLIKPS